MASLICLKNFLLKIQASEPGRVCKDICCVSQQPQDQQKHPKTRSSCEEVTNNGSGAQAVIQQTTMEHRGPQQSIIDTK